MSNDLIKQTDDALDNPLSAQYTMPRSSKPLFPTPGVERQVFIDVVRAACLIHNMTDGNKEDYMNPRVIKPYLGKSVKMEDIKRVIESSNFVQALMLRGVMTPDDSPLSGEQLRALSVLTDVTSTAGLDTRLKRAGIEPWKWTAWMNNAIFRAAHDRIAHDIFEKASSSVDMQIMGNAVNGKLEFIKYYHEITGKYDKTKRSNQDIQMLLNDVVEIITRNVTDPETLKRISSELSMVVSKLG